MKAIIIVEFDAAETKKEIQDIMWNYAGLIRNEKGLKTAIKELSIIKKSLPEGVNQELIEAKNMVDTGMLVAKAALKRKRSLGCHFREDNQQ